MSANIPVIPNYEHNMSIYDYNQQIEQFKLAFFNDKYNLILKFINVWLDSDETYKLKTLREFKNISKSYLLRNLEHNKEILRKYSKEIKEKLNLKCNINYTDNDKIKIKDGYILYFISRALNKIDYKFSIKKTNYYSIINKR